MRFNCVPCISTCSSRNSGVKGGWWKQKKRMVVGIQGREDVKAFIHKLLKSSLFHTAAFPPLQGREHICTEKITSSLRAASQTSHNNNTRMGFCTAAPMRHAAFSNFVTKEEEVTVFINSGRFVLFILME